MNDISEYKIDIDVEAKLSLLSDELSNCKQALEEFAYAVSHDLREPLRMVASYLQLIDMENGEKFDEQSKEFMKTASDGARRMNTMLDGLLQYSRVSTQGGKFVASNCKQLVSEAIENLAVKIDESKAQITIENLPEEIIVDEGQIIEVFYNLIDNAINYAKPEVAPQIEISCTDAGLQWCFCVSDSGIGIEADFFERIFKVFQKLGDKNSGGCGMGLAISKRIIERHSGRMWVEAAIGQGTAVFFTLPKTQKTN